jgi:hypothetical protein
VSVTARDFAGVWTLADWRRTGGDVTYPFGEGARGRIAYDASGSVAAFLMRADWGATGPAGGPGFMAYAGRWRVDGNEVRHAVEFASIPGWVGTTLVREWSFTPDGTLVLLTPWRDAPAGRTRDQLSWRREAPGS